MRLPLAVAPFIALLWCPHPLTAQGITQPVEVKPKACAASDSLLGPALQLGKSRVSLVAPPDGSVTILLIEASPTEPRGTPIESVIFMLQYAGRRAPAAQLNMQFNVVDSVLRAGPTSELRLSLDDSVTWQLGPTRVEPHRGAKPSRVPQGLSTSLTADESRRFAKATTVHGWLGSTAFAFTPAQLAASRALLTVAICGQSR